MDIFEISIKVHPELEHKLDDEARAWLAKAEAEINKEINTNFKAKIVDVLLKDFKH